MMLPPFLLGMMPAMRLCFAAALLPNGGFFDEGAEFQCVTSFHSSTPSKIPTSSVSSISGSGSGGSTLYASQVKSALSR